VPEAAARPLSAAEAEEGAAEVLGLWLGLGLGLGLADEEDFLDDELVEVGSSLVVEVVVGGGGGGVYVVVGVVWVDVVEVV
jgi:hypothetical protein